ncbi:integrase, catalytic region, zinc finger, CCHC-type containing protein [Tanacetum coccineum]
MGSFYQYYANGERYAQWQSTFLKYIDTHTKWLCLKENAFLEVPDRNNSGGQFYNVSESKANFESEKEAMHLHWTGIGDEIFSNVDAIADSSMKCGETIESATTRNKGKEIAKPITPPSESASEEDSDLEQAQKDKEMQKNLALIAKYFKKIYKPTNNNLRTFLNTKNKNVDTTPRYKIDNHAGQFRNKRTMSVVGAKETVGGQVVQQSGIQCFNCKESGHFAKECKKPKRVKDSTYHKEKMLLCKQAEKGVPLQAEQSDWLADTDEEIDE